jgi:nuclear pore complex protein Nup37
MSNFSFDCQEIIHSVEFSPFENSSNLIAYGGNNRVSLGVCQFGDDADNETGFQFNHVADFHHGTRVQGIAWSPKTSVSNLPASVQ